jgi:hypothetical protein
MALRNLALARTPANSAEPQASNRSVTFVHEGHEHQVDIAAPRAIRRGRRRMVQLMDLWVASLLPGDFLELRFSLVTSNHAGVVRRSAPLEALHFARGFVSRRERALFWEEDDGALNGLRLESIEVAPALASVVRMVPAKTLPVRPPPPHPPHPRHPLRLDLRRLLPHAMPYPQVQWQFRDRPR